MHSSRDAYCLLIDRISSYPMHAPPKKNHTCPPEKTTHAPRKKPRMPPQKNHAHPLEKTMHTPRKNHACPPEKTTHAPQQKPRMPPPGATMHIPPVVDRQTPVKT